MTVTDEAPDPKAALLSSLQKFEIDPAQTLGIAYSGGADSTALMAAACELRDAQGSPYHGVRLLALYLDHGIRDEQERADEASLVRQTCFRLGVPLIEQHLEPGSLQRNAQNAGLEAAAREARYLFFANTVRAGSADLVLTAHHRDDQLETILLRFLRGGGPEAGGMSEFRWLYGVRVLRPWLSLPKNAVTAYVQQRGLEHVTDSSNSNTVFTRNRVRHQLMPFLDEMFPEYRSTLPVADERTRMVADFLREETKRRVQWEPYGRGWCTNRKSFFAVPHVVRVESLKQLCIRSAENGATGVPGVTGVPGATGVPGVPTAGFFFQIASEDDGSPVRILAAGGGWRLQQFHELILWGLDVVLTGKNRYVLVVREGMRVVLGRGDRPVVSTPKPQQAVPACEIQLDAANIAAPLILRTRRSGDSIKVGTGSKSVKKLLSEWRIPPNVRDQIPVLEDRGGLCAVVGRPFGYQDLVATRVRPHRNEPDESTQADKSLVGTKNFRLWVQADGVENEYAE